MIPSYKVDADDLLNWARYLEEIPKVTNAAIARALNDFGEGVARNAAMVIAGKADLPWSEVLDLLEIREASPRRLVWELDTSKFFSTAKDWSRPWQGRDSKQYEKQTLVNITTLEDKFTCEVCEEAAARGPYTMAEIDEMASRWKNWTPAVGPASGFRTNLIHPNCRCVLTPFASARRVPVSFGTNSAPEELFNVRQLGQMVAAEVRVAIKAVKKPSGKK